MKNASGQYIRLGEGVSAVVFLATVPSRRGSARRSLAAVKCFKKDQPFWMTCFFKEASFLQRLSGQDSSPYMFGFTHAKENPKYHRLVMVTEFLGDPVTLKATSKWYLKLG